MVYLCGRKRLPAFLQNVLLDIAQHLVTPVGTGAAPILLLPLPSDGVLLKITTMTIIQVYEQVRMRTKIPTHRKINKKNNY